VVSVSCPTAEISGIALSAAARTTASSLKPQRSSTEPPPRATMITSGRGTGPPGVRALKPRIAAETSAAHFSPCTATGHKSTRRGNRSARRCRMSRITAPEGEVTTPITSGRKGGAFFRSGANRPSAASFAFSFSSCAISAPTPAGAMRSMIS